MALWLSSPLISLLALTSHRSKCGGTIAFMKTIGAIPSTLLAVFGSLALLFAQAPAQQQRPEFVKQGQQLIRHGKTEEALSKGRPYSLNLRFSSLPMTKVARHRIAKAMASETPIKSGVIVIEPRCFRVSRMPCSPPLRTRTVPPNRTSSNPMKISIRQPARSPRGPRKSDLMPDAGWKTLTGAVDPSEYSTAFS